MRLTTDTGSSTSAHATADLESGDLIAPSMLRQGRFRDPFGGPAEDGPIQGCAECRVSDRASARRSCASVDEPGEASARALRPNRDLALAGPLEGPSTWTKRPSKRSLEHIPPQATLANAGSAGANRARDLYLCHHLHGPAGRDLWGTDRRNAHRGIGPLGSSQFGSFS